MNEIRERESELEAAIRVAAERKAHATRLHEANMHVSHHDLHCSATQYPSCSILLLARNVQHIVQFQFNDEYIHVSHMTLMHNDEVSTSVAAAA